MSTPRKRLAASLGLAVAISGLAAIPASANTAGTGLVISEVYLNGGSTGATYLNKYAELYNPTDQPISLAGMSLQYRAPAPVTPTAASAFALTGTIPAKGYYLIQGGSNGANGVALPTSNQTAGFNPGGGGGLVMLVNGPTPVTAPAGSLTNDPSVIDLYGYGTSTTFEGVVGKTASTTTSVQRNATNADTDNNANDFAALAPSPGTSHVAPPPAENVGSKTIADVQGTEAVASPLAGKIATVRGVVTADYDTGGYDGFYIQTPGTGGATDATPGASDALFIYGSAATAKVAVGNSVEVTGLVSEFGGSTQITPADAGAVTVLTEALAPVTPLSIAIPVGDAAKEAHEGELLAPAGDIVVTNSYDTNKFGEIGLATGGKPLIAPTEIADAQDKAAIDAVVADNAARAITLDDGSSLNYLTTGKDTPLPWLRKDNPVRVGAKVTFKSPVVLEYRNSVWKLQPTTQVTDAGTSVATFQNTRTPAPEDVGGDIRLATFNVLNYFPTTAEEFVKAGGTNKCTYYNDRDGNPITANSCTPNGPRGAADAANLARQQDKSVTAINKLGASIVSLEEIENSVKFGKDRDFAVATLVQALNTAAGSAVWAYVPSPAASGLPALADQDVIRTAFIYKPADVRPVGASRVLVGNAAFKNARQPLAQAFKATGAKDATAFAVIVNHFKSKGSGVDDGTGQGNANPDRVAQAGALADFADTFKSERGISKVFLTGDFNAYSMEDPIQVLEGRGYHLVDSTTNPQEETYSYSGLVGSLDHVLANTAAKPMVTGADVWQINSAESVGYEYSRHNYNAVDLYAADPFKSSDHDPEVIGLELGQPDPSKLELNLLAVNDFHGRINTNTVKWAGTIEQLANRDDNDTLLVGAGDLVGASEFASSSANDQPTIDMFNALGLDASAVGNHEFDQGWTDLRERIIGADGARNAKWDYLGANVYLKGTQTPAMQQYATYTVDGVTVGVIGAVTEETSTLVSPGGITALDFGDPVAAVDKVAKELSDGNAVNGEADIIVAAFHAGATQGLGSSYADQIAKGGEFAKMASLDASVDVIINGHTHQAYAWNAPVPGSTTRTRPIIQTGEYATNVGQIKLTIDKTTGNVDAYVVRNVARTTASDDDLVAQYPRVAQVKTIVDAATSKAAEIGNQPVGSITGDITRALSGGSYVDGKWTAGTTEDRGSESALGGLVANALRDGLPTDAGKADLGIVNPGGLRAEMKYAGDTSKNPANTDGVVTYAEANAVLPFVNNVWTVKLTGADLESVLEEQWQPDGSSRPYLNLGLSDNIRVTQDATKPRGERITSVIIDGVQLDPAKVYTVSTFSFLGTGGDNFGSFKKGTPKDTGLVDRDLWISYLKKNDGLSPDFARQQVSESGMPSKVTAGDAVSFKLSNLNLTSLGSPENASVSVELRTARGMRSMGTFPVTNGVADITFTAPADLAGTATITATVMPSRTLIGLPATTDPVPVDKASSTTSATATPSSVKVLKGTSSVSVTVAAEGVTPTGTVEAWVDGAKTGSATLTGGKATLTAGPFTSIGAKEIELRYAGDDNTEPSKTTTSVSVVKADSTTSAAATPSSVKVGSGTVAIDATVTGDGVAPTGTVEAWVNGAKTGSASLVEGKASLTAGPFTSTGTKEIELRYVGDDNTEPSKTTTSVTVVKADSTTSAAAAPSSVKVMKGTSSVKITVAADGVQPTGTVQILQGDTVLDRATLVSGSATVTVGPFTRVGTKTLRIRYSGDGAVEPSSTTTTVSVVKATARMAVSHSPRKVVVKRTRAVVSVDLSAPGLTPTGSVQFRLDGTVLATRQLSDGEASFKLPRLTGTGSKTIKVVYSGDARTESQTVTHTIRVTR